MEKKRLTKIIIVCGLLLLGFVFPAFIRDTVEEIVWDGEKSALVILALLGSAFFVASGLIIGMIIKGKTNKKPLMRLVAVLMFFVFGISYNAISMINMIKNRLGLFGSYMIKSAGLSSVTTVATIGLIITSVGIICICLPLFTSGINEKGIAEKKKITTKEPRCEKEVPIKSSESKPEERPKIKVEPVKREESIPGNRIKSTMRTASKQTATEKVDDFKPAGDL